MFTLLVFVSAIMVVSCLITIVAVALSDIITPVGKLFSFLFAAAVTVILLILVMHAGPRVAVRALAVSTPVYSHAETIVRTADASVIADHPAQVVAVAPAYAQAPVMAQPNSDSGVKDMLLGGALGYMAGSAGRGSSETHTVTSHTTIIHAAPPSPPPAAAPVAAATPRAAPVAARSTWRSTFSMTRGRR